MITIEWYEGMKKTLRDTICVLGLLNKLILNQLV